MLGWQVAMLTEAQGKYALFFLMVRCGIAHFLMGITLNYVKIRSKLVDKELSGHGIKMLLLAVQSAGC